MAVPVVLNELSCAGWPASPHTGAEYVRELARSLAELSRLRRRTFLLSEVRIGTLSFGHYTLASLLRDGGCQDAIRQILAFANRAPLSSFANLDADGCECKVDGVEARAVLFAHLLHTLIVSFPSKDLWRGPSINIDLLEIGPDARIVSTNLEVPNLACAEQVPLHRELLAEFRGIEIIDARNVWAHRAEWFPSLTFLARVEGDLKSLPFSSVALEQVVGRLFELEIAIGEWVPDNGLPSWRSKVTPESEQRKGLCRFICADGQQRTYEWHARFTPGAGRIHFRMLAEERLAEVAYIGLKLG